MSEQLLSSADIALYQAKAAGGGNWFVDANGNGHSSCQRLHLEQDFRKALEAGQARSGLAARL